MGDLRLDREERAERLAEIERELEDEVGMSRTVEAEPVLVARKKRSNFTWGKAVLYALGALIAFGVVKWLIRMFVPLLLLALLIGGVFWLIGLLTKGDHSED